MTDLEFNQLMHRFREAGAALARQEQIHQEHAAGKPRQPLSVALAGDVRTRWLVPALAAVALVATGVSWSAWEYTHPAHRGEVIARSIPVAPSAAPATLSDEALLSAVQNDLSDRVPQALQPLAVSYTSNTHAQSGQEETKE